MIDPEQLKKYPTYDVASLQANINKADQTIQTLEQAIMDEQARKRELRVLIAQCEERDAVLKQLGDLANHIKGNIGQ